MEQRSLFLSTREKKIRLPGAELTWIEGFIEGEEADALFEELSGQDGWRQDDLTMFGRQVPIPRLHRWFADEGQSYSWSGITMRAERFPASLDVTREKLETRTGTWFNTALANLYRDGNDSVSWHADDERELGPKPLIASLSLGAPRKFRMRRRDDHSQRFDLTLTHGSMLVLGGDTQRQWEHCVPKTRKPVSPRRADLS
ncbi:MAG: alkylated DNA repair dioxygenase AlkB, partial [Polyangiales bacterium]